MENQEVKIRRGQAFNLAVSDAIALRVQTDVRYIYQQFIYYYELASIVQSTDLELIHEVLNKPNFVEAIKKLKESIV